MVVSSRPFEKWFFKVESKIFFEDDLEQKKLKKQFSGGKKKLPKKNFKIWITWKIQKNKDPKNFCSNQRNFSKKCCEKIFSKKSKEMKN